MAVKKDRIEQAKDKIRDRYEFYLNICIQDRVTELLRIRQKEQDLKKKAEKIATELDDLNKGNLKHDYVSYDSEATNHSEISQLATFKNIADIK